MFSTLFMSANWCLRAIFFLCSKGVRSGVRNRFRMWSGFCSNLYFSLPLRMFYTACVYCTVRVWYIPYAYGLYHTRMVKYLYRKRMVCTVHVWSYCTCMHGCSYRGRIKSCTVIAIIPITFLYYKHSCILPWLFASLQTIYTAIYLHWTFHVVI